MKINNVVHIYLRVDMPIFYAIHNLDWGQNLSNVRRNCRTFIYGVCIYMFIYLIIKNLQIQGYLGKMYDAIFTAFVILIAADVSVVGFIYRNYYGRSIAHELSDHEDKENWIFDPITHKYLKKTDEQKLAERKLQQIQINADFERNKKLLQDQIERHNKHPQDQENITIETIDEHHEGSIDDNDDPETTITTEKKESHPETHTTNKND
jgi:hypothetical protein